MQQNPIPILILSGLLIYLIYQEISLIRMYLYFRKNGKLGYAEIIKKIQPHHSTPIYKVKIENLNMEYSKHRIKITLLSSFFPRLLGSEFKVYYLADSDCCIIATPIMIIIDLVMIVLFSSFIMSLT
jgi:hypothetical protein